ncbi:glycosyltransferase [Clostridiaceae bacterium]|nr:glycosyltransferase [Clostridiaceae bacterium]RKI13563.1 glycosyltransferase [bacterium 1XD21-70]
MRMGLLAESLSQNGHNVVWWSSTFIHGSKDYYSNCYKKIQISGHEKLILLHSQVSYKKNISLQRLIYHHNLGIEFRKHCEEEEQPDIILCSYPIVQFCIEAEHYAKKNNIPLIVDVRDLWPDIFVRAFPQNMHKIVRMGLFPLDIQANYVMKRADAIIGVVPSMVQWGLQRAHRKKTRMDQVIYIGSTSNLADNQEELKLALEKWNLLGVNKSTWNLCFVGTLSSNSLDLSTCIEAAKGISKEYPDFRLIICGDGDGRENYKKLAANSKNIIFAGWCDKYQIQSLFSIGNAGLYPYKNWDDFKNAFGNKIVKYMSGGLPVVSSLTGFSKKYIEKYRIGLVYREKDQNSLKKVIKSLIVNPEKSKSMGVKAKKCFNKDFDVLVINNKFEKLMSEIIERVEKR